MRRIIILVCLGLALGGCAPASNVEEGQDASHIETSACTGDASYCECVQSAEVSGLSTEDAQQACSQ